MLHLDLGMYGMPASRKKVVMATHIGVKDHRKKEEIKRKEEEEKKKIIISEEYDEDR